MEECIKKEYISFIQKQLAEMAKTVKKNSSKNQAKRENNIFFIFSDFCPENLVIFLVKKASQHNKKDCCFYCSSPW